MTMEWPTHGRRSKSNPPRLKIRVAEAQGRRCFFCGCQMVYTGSIGRKTLKKFPNAVTREHLVPRAHGGTNDYRNIAATCIKCNTERGSDIFKFEPHPEVLAKLKELPECQRFPAP